MKRRGNYVTSNIKMACLSKEAGKKKDIHDQLAETIAERRRIMERWESSLSSQHFSPSQNIHEQLRDTIDELRRVMQLSAKVFSRPKEYSLLLQDKSAA